MTKHRMKETYDNAGTLVFWCQRNSDVMTSAGRQTQMGSAKVGDFRPIFRYISEMVQDKDINRT